MICQLDHSVAFSSALPSPCVLTTLGRYEIKLHTLFYTTCDSPTIFLSRVESVSLFGSWAIRGGTAGRVPQL